MFQKILIANRGEIAVRIIRACRELGITSVAVYSTADKDALHTQLADEAICIGKAAPADSYLNMERILSAAIASKAEAIHPGFGFLSENAKFAQMCEQCHIAFIGPSAEVIRRMGNKQEARNTMINAKVPVVPGTKEAVYTADYGLKLAEQIGFPVMIKAASGGGGKGMRISRSVEDFTENFEVAQTESVNGFADDTMYIEKYIEDPRHIEFQILADKYGNVISLGERDCSIQRRHQKMVEESPSAALDDKLRAQMGEVAVRAAKAAKYESAGTIEFLLDKNKKFYFMEMNTRIQVEHPVTELVTGLDLIKEQIFIAAGEKLQWKQKDIHITGHAIECRINAENPAKNFMPCPGKIEYLHLPGGNGVRIDSAIYTGYTIPPNYDSMIAKIIVYGKDRQTAIDKMRSALGEVNIDGITT
ncbi:acetyl-CoA carboxylase biotin carboxylase subunit, partial [uncultured Eubacterium sp.]|uniref:acetyl-CoA carboxylase biotin carboxylase subunit n=1 Tax=uncultured Eubacterium sp. TaxID=165185 RepID=UPI0025FB8048